LLQVYRQEQELVEAIAQGRREKPFIAVVRSRREKALLRAQQLSVQGQIPDSKTQADASGCTLRKTF
jgi:hypothetical protein